MHEAKRVRPEVSTEKNQAPPDGEKRVTATVSDHIVCGRVDVCE